MTKKRLLQVGEKVRVRRNGCDHAFPEKFASKIGTVKSVDTNTCGSMPEDPLYIVAVRFIGTDSFWGEELRRLPQPKVTT